MANCGFEKEKILLFFQSINIGFEKLDENMKKNIIESLDVNEKLIKKHQDFNYVRLINWKIFSPILGPKKNKEEKLSRSEDEIKKLYDLLNDKDKDEERLERLLFVFRFINTNRIDLKELDKERFDILNKIFKICMDYGLENVDKNTEDKFIELLSYIPIISQTYYYINDNGKHICINDGQFKTHDLLKKENYWKIALSAILNNQNYNNVKMTSLILVPMLISFYQNASNYLSDEKILELINQKIKRWNIAFTQKEINELKQYKY